MKANVMVLTWAHTSGFSVWVDYEHRCRTLAGLYRKLRGEFRSHRIAGYRFITIHQEEIGHINKDRQQHADAGGRR
jgi:hypothetical protein